jgi:hypothetical protein
MSISRKAADAYSLYKKAKKAKDYSKLVKDAIDEDTRPGAVLKLGIKGMLDLAGKVLGTSLTSHPYFTYHKAHIEALALALNASSGHDKALVALNQAIRSADAAKLLTKTLADYHFRKNALKLTYFQFLEGSLVLLRDSATDARAAKEMQDAGHTPQSLKTYTDQGVYEWQARWCELWHDSVQLLAMGQVELRATEAAMSVFDAKMKSLSSGGNLGKIAAYGVERDRQWQQYERMTKPGAGSERAVEDPVGYARDQVASIERVSDLMAECCDVAMSEQAYRPGMILQSIGNK